MSEGRVVFHDEPLDTLTVKFWRDEPGPLYAGAEEPGWGCHFGPDFVGGCGGFGRTPLEALRDLCTNIARDEGPRTDRGRLLLR